MNPLSLANVMSVFSLSRKISSKLVKMKGELSQEQYEYFQDRVGMAEYHLSYERLEEIEAELEELKEN